MVAIPVGGAVVGRQHAIVAAFRKANATTPERGVPVASLGIHEGMAFRILRRHGVLRDAGDRCHLDEPTWEAHCARRRRLAFLIPGCVLVVVIVPLWIVLG